jgi:hypothetical protein
MKTRWQTVVFGLTTLPRVVADLRPRRQTVRFAGVEQITYTYCRAQRPTRPTRGS